MERADEPVGKIFCIGLSRTGTTSLHHALLELGLRSAPNSAALLDDIDDAILDRFDAFADNPIPFLYPELDRLHPGSRFIWTTRPLDEWLASMRWLFDVGVPRLDPEERALGERVHRELYGLDAYDEAVLRDAYRHHTAQVEHYFEGRRSDVLHLPLDELDWEPLASFLGRPVPPTPFPRVNQRTPAPPWSRRLMRRLRR